MLETAAGHVRRIPTDFLPLIMTHARVAMVWQRIIPRLVMTNAIPSVLAMMALTLINRYIVEETAPYHLSMLLLVS